MWRRLFFQRRRSFFKKLTHIAYIGLGSNVGDHRDTLNKALDMLRSHDGIEVLRVSRFIDTAPVGPPQGRFTNAAAKITCQCGPHELLDILNGIEAALGRDRSREIFQGPRTCDLDIELFDDCIINDQKLTVPHERMAERFFVLAPLAEIAADVIVPDSGKTVRELLEELPGSRGVGK